MNGPHDMGGMHGFGAVLPEAGEPVFHAGWQRRVFALTLAMGFTGEWTIDDARFARERLPSDAYFVRDYYGRWLDALERMLVARGLVAPGELASGRVLEPPRQPVRILPGPDVAAALRRGAPSIRDPARPALFQAGDRVRARNMHPSGHTRLPRYARGRTGTVGLVHGCHVFPDARTQGRADDAHWLYTVQFDARELWGPEADPTVTVSVDAFEPYLEPAP